MGGGLETEYKFLVKSESWKMIDPAEIKHIKQYYFPTTPDDTMALSWRKNDREIAITAAFPDGKIVMPVPQNVIATFGEENLEKLGSTNGFIPINQQTEARIREAEGSYVLTIKAKTDAIASRLELEFPISAENALKLIPHCPKHIEKTRHVIESNGQRWEVDVFGGRNQGLTTVEIESDKPPETLPDWIGENITGVEKYSNQKLAHIGYAQWAGTKAHSR